MNVRPANAVANSLGDLFPHETTMENDDSNLEWLSVYVEDCFSSSTSYPHPVSGKSSPEMAGKAKLLPPSSSNPRRKRRSLASVMNDDDEKQYGIPLFAEPPLLLTDQKHWMAESELILPKKGHDKELCQQQKKEQEEEEEKCDKGMAMQFQQQRLVKRCAYCLSDQAPRRISGPSGIQMLCNACGLGLKLENRFAAISEEQCDEETSRYQAPEKQRDKKKMRKAANTTIIKEPQAVEPVKSCTHCMSSKTPQWRAGPLGPKTLCNACGVRFKSGRLLPEYRPANSPTFVSCLHSNSHKKVLQLRQSVGHKAV